MSSSEMHSLEHSILFFYREPEQSRNHYKKLTYYFFDKIIGELFISIFRGAHGCVSGPYSIHGRHYT